MNLIEARKLAHEGWVRSPSQTHNRWVRLGENMSGGVMLVLIEDHDCRSFRPEDLDAEDWEPRPKPVELFEADVWVHAKNNQFDIQSKWQTAESTAALLRNGWRKIRVREVSSPEESSTVSTVETTSAPAADKSGRKVWSNMKQAYVDGSVCHKCGGVYADYWCCSTAMGGS